MWPSRHRRYSLHLFLQYRTILGNKQTINKRISANERINKFTINIIVDCLLLLLTETVPYMLAVRVRKTALSYYHASVVGSPLNSPVIVIVVVVVVISTASYGADSIIAVSICTTSTARTTIRRTFGRGIFIGSFNIGFWFIIRFWTSIIWFWSNVILILWRTFNIWTIRIIFIFSVNKELIFLKSMYVWCRSQFSMYNILFIKPLEDRRH